MTQRAACIGVDAQGVCGSTCRLRQAPCGATAVSSAAVEQVVGSDIAPANRTHKRSDDSAETVPAQAGRHTCQTHVVGHLEGAFGPMEQTHLGAEVISADEIQARVAEMGAQISTDYAGRDPVCICVLKGGFVFMADLLRAVDIPVETEFMAVSSYGSQVTSSGVVRIIKDVDIDITDRHVLIVEDIVDSGLTLAYLQRMLKARHPASLAVCTLLRKDIPDRDGNIAYVGFKIPDFFVVGYGLDADERFRNLPNIVQYLPETD